MRVQAVSGTRLRGEGGIALITTILVMMLMSALLVGFTTVVMSDQHYRMIDRDRVRAFYAAHSGLEKLNVELRNLFFANVAPSPAQVAAMSNNPPSLPDVTFITTGDGAYGAKIGPATSGTINTGPYAGLIALKKKYTLESTAKTAGNGESHLVREVETVAIPVFQFGMFSEVDLSFSAADEFDFGGRVHTNGNLFLAQGGGATLWLRDKVTAVGEVVRQELSNGASIDTSGSTATVRMATAPNAFRNLARTEGSVTQGPESAVNKQWPTISGSYYNAYIRNGRTGARALNLPLITTGGANIDLIKRPGANEDTANPTLLSSRYFNNVSLRILLSDTETDITSLPTIASGSPVSLQSDWKASPPSGYAVDSTHPPIARSPGRLLVGGVAPTVDGADSAGSDRLVTLNTVLPSEFMVATSAPSYYALRLTRGSNSFVVTCSGKTTTSFTGCGRGILVAGSGTSLSSGTTVESVRPSTQARVQATTSANWTTSSTTITIGSGTNTNNFERNAFTLTVKKGASTHTVHCAAKTPTSFIGCKPESNPSSSVSSTSGSIATVSATVPTLDDNATLVSTTIPIGSSYQWASPWGEIHVASTLGFSTNTFWVHSGNTNSLVSCGGYIIPDDLTDCNLTESIADNATVTSAALTDPRVGTIGGFIKIEMQDTTNTWRDVTSEILSYGIADRNRAGVDCGDPTPNAIVRLQRLRDNNETSSWSPSGQCTYSSSQLSSDYWPKVLFDAREAVFRDDSAGSHPLFGGVMHYVSLDIENLSSWFEGTGAYSGSSGPNALSTNGYSVYFSDRRNNRNASNLETGEYGFEDVVNPASGTGTPNGSLQQGEDFNQNGTLETYGQFPSYNGTKNSVPPGAVAPFTTSARPTDDIRASEAMVNRSIFYRRALKLVRGNLGIVEPGLTIAAENPIYIQGDYNYNSTGVSNPNTVDHAATSVVGDSVTLLTGSWNDVDSLTSPYDTGGRRRSGSHYVRTAIIAGKGPIFPRPSGAGATFGTDGGAHSFLRFLEGGSGTIYYRGSLATFYYNRQAVSPFKCCGGVVYDVPAREYTFDIDFLDPEKLPPLTPVFRDINSLGFTQDTRQRD